MDYRISSKVKESRVAAFALENRVDIRPGDRVLDAGCGAYPFPFATHMVDAKPADNSERFGLPIPKSIRPLYHCSVEDMPFGDAEFDFVYCAHVLEHVSDPGRACRELMRIARRGYIECPRSWTEYVFSSERHRWLVDLEDNVLIFREKRREEYGDPLGIQYSIFTWLQDRKFRLHWSSPHIRALRNVEFYWEKSFRFFVLPADGRNNRGAFPRFYNSSQTRPRPRAAEDLKHFLTSELRRALRDSEAVALQSLNGNRRR